MTNEEIQAIFFVECEESLFAAEEGLASMRAGTQDGDTVNGVFRAVHSIKGGAGAFGFTLLQNFAHEFEALLSEVRDGTVPITSELSDLLLRALDTLSDHVNAARDGSDAPQDQALLAELVGAHASGLASAADEADETEPQKTEAPADEAAEPSEESSDDALDLDALLDDLSGAPPVQENTAEEAPQDMWQMHLRAHAGAMTHGAEPVLLLRELDMNGARCIACDTSYVPPIDSFDPSQGYLGWSFEIPASFSESDAREIFEFGIDDWDIATGADAAIPPVRIEEQKSSSKPAPSEPKREADASVGQAADVDAPISPAPAPEPASQTPAAHTPTPASQTIRIDLQKLDRLIDTVGEMVIAQAMLSEKLSQDGLANDELLMLEGLTRDIQESAMAIRAQPIGSVFSRVPRILRELASSTGKHVQLEVKGEATELDKTVLERLGEPLTHLIRNAVDHGIEKADDRLAAGKPAEGTLTLSAEQRSGRIFIAIADDGKGINREQVFAKAVEKGVIAPDAQLSPEEINELIFAPGFSTAQVVTSVSGRGVGMDVVRQNVRDLGGRISIESEPGKGTVFTLSLPLTLAISDGMIVNVDNETYVVPLTHVVESLRPSREDIQGLGSSMQMLNVRGRFIPIVPVGKRSRPHAAPNPCDGVLIVVDTQAKGQVALLVDLISDQRQFVIKSLEAGYRAVNGVAGATILGDGNVALILDVEGYVADVLEPAVKKEAA